MKKIGVCPSCHKDFVVDTEKTEQVCPYCGASFPTDKIPTYAEKPASVPTPAPVRAPNAVEPATKKHNSGAVIAVTLVLLAVVITAGIFIAKALTGTNTDPNTANKVTERALENSDFSASGSQDLTSYTVTITPTIAIKTFTVALTLYNSKGSSLYSDTQSKSSLSRYTSYSYTFDFGFVNSFSGSYIRCFYTGVVSLL